MASTSFRSDPARIKKEMEMSTYEGRYMLNCGGPGVDVPFFEDPQVRLQKYGANLRSNTIGVEDDLMGRNRVLGRDYIDQTYEKKAAKSDALSFKSKNPFVQESRASVPSWIFRGVDQKYERWEHPWINPQANLEKNFNDNIQTRLQEKSVSETENNDWNVWLPTKK